MAVGGKQFLSCLALPIPASILMLTAGGFVAAGDLTLWQTLAAAAGGGIAGDQLGYWTGRRAGAPLLTRLRCDLARDKLMYKALAIMDRRGIIAVFLTRWLLSPLGPWVNPTAGSTGYGWRPLHDCGRDGRGGLGRALCRYRLCLCRKHRNGKRHFRVDYRRCRVGSGGSGPWLLTVACHAPSVGLRR